MALKLSLKANERIIAGGAVLRNATGKTVELTVENEVPLLREKEILSEAKADTPCKRVYFVIQLMYIDGQNLPKYQKLYWDLARDILNAAPSTTGMFIGQFVCFVLEGDGDITAFVSFITQALDSRGKAIQRGFDRFIVHVLAGLFGKHLMDQRGLAV